MPSRFWHVLSALSNHSAAFSIQIGMKWCATIAILSLGCFTLASLKNAKWIGHTVSVFFCFNGSKHGILHTQSSDQTVTVCLTWLWNNSMKTSIPCLTSQWHATRIHGLHCGMWFWMCICLVWQSNRCLLLEQFQKCAGYKIEFARSAP